MKCKYGGKKGKLCNRGECETCFNKSFASSNHDWMWDGNKVISRLVSLNSTNLYWFKCERDHFFIMKPNKINKLENPCIECRRTGEAELLKIFIEFLFP